MAGKRPGKAVTRRLLAAVFNGRLDQARDMIGADPDPASLLKLARDGSGQTLLHRAAAGGDERTITWALALLAEHAWPVALDEPDAAYHTPLMLAVAEGPHEGAVALLLEAGARPDTARPTGWSAVTYAAAAGSDACMSLLLAACGGDAAACAGRRNKEGSTPAYLAARSGGLACLARLRGAGAPLGRRNHHERALLHAAAGWDRVDVARALLCWGVEEQAGEEPSGGGGAVPGPAGDAPALDRPGGTGRPESLGPPGRQLLSRDESGATPLHMAAASDAASAVALLLTSVLPHAGADGELAAQPGAAALGAAVSVSWVPSARACAAALAATDTTGRTPLHAAALAGAASALALLLRASEACGSPLDAADAEGATALHAAASAGHAGAVAALLRAGADPAAPDGRAGQTALHRAVSWGRDDVVLALLAHDASLAALPDGAGRAASACVSGVRGPGDRGRTRRLLASTAEALRRGGGTSE